MNTLYFIKQKNIFQGSCLVNMIDNSIKKLKFYDIWQKYIRQQEKMHYLSIRQSPASQKLLESQKKDLNDSLILSITSYEDTSRKYRSWSLGKQTNLLDSKGEEIHRQLNILHNKLIVLESKVDSVPNIQQEKKAEETTYNHELQITQQRCGKFIKQNTQNNPVQFGKFFKKNKKNTINKDNQSKDPNITNPTTCTNRRQGVAGKKKKPQSLQETLCKGLAQYKLKTSNSVRNSEHSHMKQLNTLRKQMLKVRISAQKNERSKEKYSRQLNVSKRKLKQMRKTSYNHEKVIDKLQKELRKSENIRQKQKKIIAQQKKELHQLKQMLKENLQLKKFRA